MLKTCSIVFNSSNRISYSLMSYWPDILHGCSLDIIWRSAEAKTSFPWCDRVFKPSGRRKGILPTDTAICQLFLSIGHLEALPDLKVNDWFDVCFKGGHTLALDPQSPSFACSIDSVQPSLRYKLFWYYQASGTWRQFYEVHATLSVHLVAAHRFKIRPHVVT